MLSFAIVLGLLEAGARLVEVIRPPLPVDYGLGFDAASRLYVPDPADPAWRVTRSSKRRFFLEQRFAAEKPEATVRIVALGGSAVQYADRELRRMLEALRDPLERRVRAVELINAGGLAYGSHRLVPLLVELLEYRPDLVLLYTGHNEFEEIEQLDLARRGAPRLERALAHLAFFRLLRDGVTAVRAGILANRHDARLLASAPAQARAWNHAFTPEEIAERMSAFRRNLEIMIRLCRENGVALVIGSVPSNLYRPMLPPDQRGLFRPVFKDYRAGRWKRGAALARRLLRAAPARHQASDAENDIIRTLAERYRVPLADVEDRVARSEPHGVPGETLFRDHCHLNAHGMHLWRMTFEPIVLQLLR